MLRIIRPFPILLLLLACCCFAPDARADSLIIDPTGDTFGTGQIQHDLTSINATFTNAALTFTANFTEPIFAASEFSPRSLYGFIEIDSDRNAATGVPPLSEILGPPPAPNLGVEYGIDLSSEALQAGFVDVFNAVTGVTTGTAPITFGATSFSLTVPLSLIGGNGLVNYVMIVGTLEGPTDEATNGVTPGASAPIPEPATMLLLGTGLASIGAAVKRRRRSQNR